MFKEQEALRQWHMEVMNDLPHPDDDIIIRDGQLRADLIMEEAAETANALTGRPVSYAFHNWGRGEESHYLQPIGEGDLHLVAKCRNPDRVEVLDGACDILVVTFGTVVRMNVDLEPFFWEVHRSNMEKAGGPMREDGKRLKPPGWTPPDIRGVLNNMEAEREKS